MKRRDYLLCLLFFFIGIFSRLPLVEKMQSHMDGPTYSLALINYSFEQDNPTAPGYPLYIGFAKSFLFLSSDPHLALLYVSVLFSGIGAVIFYLFGKSLLNRSSGVVAASLFLSSPAIYFFGLTAYGYIVVLVMTSALAWCVYEISFKGRKIALLLGVVFAVSLGVRPQEIMLTLPLFLFGVFSAPTLERVKAVLSFIVTSFLWFIPFLLITGGLNHFLQASSVAAGTALPKPSLLYFMRKQFELGSGFFLTLGPGIAVIFFAVLNHILKFLQKKKITIQKKSLVVFFVVWFLPPLLFNLFVRTEHAGYQFGYLSFLIFYIAIFLSRVFSKQRNLLSSVVLFIIIGNLVLFFYDRDPQRHRTYRQTSLHFSDLRRNDYELSTKVKYIKENFLPEETIIFSSTPFWKQYMYHLPRYDVYSVDGLFSNDKRYSLLIRHGLNWDRRMYYLKSKRLGIPKTARQLILLDNDACQWAPEKARRVSFFKNACMVEMEIDKANSVRFNYHTISVSS